MANAQNGQPAPLPGQRLIGGPRRHAGVLICSLVVSAPVFVPDLLPMVDLPQHAAQVATLVDLLTGTSDWSQLYRINWLTPYLLGYLLMALLLPVTGIVLATKLVVAAALAAMPWAARYLVRHSALPARWVWLLVPATYGFAFHWGFLNFLVAAPIGIAVLGFALRYNEQPSRRRALALAVFMVLLFACHALTSLFIGALAGTDAALRRQTARQFATRLVPLFAVVPVMIWWTARTRDTEGQVHAPVVWDFGVERLTQLPSLVTGAGSWHLALFGLAIVMVPYATRQLVPTREPRRWIPLLATLGVLLTVPDVVFGNHYTYQRFGLFVVPFLLLASDPRDVGPLRRRYAGAFVIAAACLWAAITGLTFHGFSQESRSFTKMLDRMEPGRRALQMVFAKQSEFSPVPVYLHFGSWYQALRHGPVDFSFSLFSVQLVRFRPGEIPAVGYGFEWRPGVFDWQQHAGDQYDYFLIRTGVDRTETLFRGASTPPRLLARENGWWLYARETGIEEPTPDGKSAPRR